MKSSLFTMFALATLSGCATVASGTSQAIFVDTGEVEGVTCTLTDSKGGTWNVLATPASATVRKGDGPMTSVCKKEGYKTNIYAFDEEVAGATFGNIILGGGIGVLVDAASGAAQKYPDKIVILMEPESFATLEEESAWKAKKAALEAERLAAEEAKRKQQTSAPKRKRN